MTTQNPAQDVSDETCPVCDSKVTDCKYCKGEYPTLAARELQHNASELARAEAQSGVLLEDTLEWIHNSPDLTKENFSKATAELQQAQVVGGKIANGHHCGLPEYLCKHPSHTPQSSAPVVGEVATRIVRGCCESEPADPEHYDTLFISVETLRDIIESALTGRG